MGKFTIEGAIVCYDGRPFARILTTAARAGGWVWDAEREITADRIGDVNAALTTCGELLDHASELVSALKEALPEEAEKNFDGEFDELFSLICQLEEVLEELR